jgi:hypothetical protein
MNCGNCSIVGHTPLRKRRMRRRRQLGVAHQREQLVTDDPHLVAARLGDDALQPDRIARDVLQLSGAAEVMRHARSP